MRRRVFLLKFAGCLHARMFIYTKKTKILRHNIIMKKIVFTAFLAGMFLLANAQKELPSWLGNVKFSGYALTQYQASFQKGNESNSFNIRMLRLALDGRIAGDFYWKAQLQFNGNTSNLGSSPRMVDLFAEWQKYDYFRVKVGQFKRPFTFENPMNPIDQGFMSYAQNVTKLAGFSDRSGMHASNGRDIGVQFQGDFLKNASGRNLLHYQVGVYNGQGINVKDVDQQKDVIGGVWIMPMKGMRIGAFGWTGSYARKGNVDANDPDNTLTRTRRLQQRRYAFSAEYKVNDWTMRTEYIHSTGYGFSKTYQKESDAKDITVNLADGNKADGYYALVIAPIVKEKLHAKARYDLYRPKADWQKAKTQYEAGLNYNFSKNIQVNAEYAFVNDRSLSKHNYSMADVELDFRF